VAVVAYLDLAGSKTGTVQGSVTQKGREGKIAVTAVDHSILSPRDAATGLASGKRQHQPLTISKEVDRSSPLLHQMQANNEVAKKWELQFWRPSSTTGQEQQIFTIRLTNAAIASVHEQSLSEDVAFAYEQIEWIWVEGGISAMDSMRVAV
jgi:type VI secretion system secreted protein Hcp